MKPSRATAASLKAFPLHGEIIVPVAAFCVPLLISGPQWLTGTLVNAFLILAAIVLTQRAQWLVIILPSVGALAHGVLFGPFTPFLAFFLPVIWMANAVFVHGVALLRLRTAPLAALLCAAALKALLLFAAAALFVRLQWVPEFFLVSMGAIQFTTALMGGLLALGILRITRIHE